MCLFVDDYISKIKHFQLVFLCGFCFLLYSNMYIISLNACLVKNGPKKKKTCIKKVPSRPSRRNREVNIHVTLFN